MRRQNRRGGFTLSEVLAVLAIVLILGGMAFASAGLMQKRARQAACDRAAEAIYMAAQRNLYGLRAAGIEATEALAARGIAGSYDGIFTITCCEYEMKSVVYEENGVRAEYPVLTPSS